VRKRQKIDDNIKWKKKEIPTISTHTTPWWPIAQQLESREKQIKISELVFFFFRIRSRDDTVCGWVVCVCHCVFFVCLFVALVTLVRHYKNCVRMKWGRTL
jgi:hypothetical protein